MINFYLTAIRSLEQIKIDYLPKSISPNRSSDIADLKIIGRNNPVHHYLSGSNTITLDLDFYAKEKNREDVIKKCRMLESWAVNDGFDKKPEQVRITLGSIFKFEDLWVIDSIVTDFSNFDAAYNFLPKQAYVKLSLKLDTPKNRKRRDIL